MKSFPFPRLAVSNPELYSIKMKKNEKTVGALFGLYFYLPVKVIQSIWNNSSVYSELWALHMIAAELQNKMLHHVTVQQHSLVLFVSSCISMTFHPGRLQGKGVCDGERNPRLSLSLSVDTHWAKIKSAPAFTVRRPESWICFILRWECMRSDQALKNVSLSRC